MSSNDESVANAPAKDVVPVVDALGLPLVDNAKASPSCSNVVSVGAALGGVVPLGASLSQKKKAPRKHHPMPKALLGIGEKDVASFVLSLECDTNQKSETFGQEFMLAQGFNTVDEHNNPHTIDLKDLSLDHLRNLCRSIGVSHVSNLNKFTCRKQIAVWCNYQTSLKDSGLVATSYAGRLTSNICRLVNVCFSNEFYDDFRKVNDRKTRMDHEMSTTNKAFWIKACDAYNCTGKDDDSLSSFETPQASSDDFATLVFPQDDIYLAALQDNPDVDLNKYDQMTPDAFRKKVVTLFKVRRLMQKNMTQSGTHDNEPWNFVEVAMKEFTGLTKIAAYYFFMRCEANPEIDGVFQPFLDSSLKGSSVEIGEDNGSMGTGSMAGSAKKRKKEQGFDDLVGMQAKLMEETKSHHKRVVELKEEKNNETKRHNNFMQRLEIAKAMQDYGALEQLKEEANKDN
jgi:hypothetical protein